MRVTNQSLSQQVTDGAQLAFRRLAKAQEAAATGKLINRLSDDGLGAAQALDLRSFSSSLDQYRRNIDTALPFLEHTDSALADVTNVIDRARTLAVTFASGTYSVSDRQHGATEVREVAQQLLAVANTKFDGRYIFAGFKNDQPAFADTGAVVVYNGDSGAIATTSGPASTVVMNVPGDRVLQGVGVTGGDDLFDVLKDLEAALTANDVGGANGVQTQLGRLDAVLEQVLTTRTEVGARINTAEAAKESLQIMQLRTEGLRAQIEEADAIEVYSDLARHQQAFEAALQSASRVLQPSLLDYLR
jgi:flagellar hook-associated protein 3 FlgL